MIMKAKTNKRFQQNMRTSKPRLTANSKPSLNSKQIAKFEQTAKLGQTDQVKLAEQIARITEMEALFTKCEETVRQLRQAIENKASITPDLINFASVLKDLFDFNDLALALSTLEAYYTSPAWRTDFEADEAGLLPSDLKRGVLSEDGIYNLLEDFKWVEEEVKELFI